MDDSIIKISVDTKSLNHLIRTVDKKLDRYTKKINKLTRKLAEMGATNVSLGYARALYDGYNDIEVSVEEAENGFDIIASGEKVLFVEFGTGITMGYGHPQAGEFGYGPGTYNPRSKNWQSPYGWYFKDADGQKYHTYGNPPSMTMYETAKQLKDAVLETAKAVLLNA
ncbi:MAG: hypothetical protein ACI4EU_08400 [Butyrivibrio sp.]